VTTVFTVREAGPADYLAMVELLDAEDFGEHGRQCRQALDAGCRMDGHWQVAVAGSPSNAATTVVGVVHADLAIDYGDLVANRGHQPPHAFISALVIDPAHRRRGVGRGLLQAVAAAAAKRGSRFLVLVPQDGDSAGNDPAAFFRACGLVALEAHIEGVPTRYGAPVADVVRARREITQSFDLRSVGTGGFA